MRDRINGSIKFEVAIKPLWVPHAYAWTKREAIVNSLTILEKLNYYQIIGLSLGMYAMR